MIPIIFYITPNNKLMEESIYSLIQPEPTLKFKPAMFRSQFPGVIAPTGSTFNNKTTNNQGVSQSSYYLDQQCEWLNCVSSFPPQLQE